MVIYVVQGLFAILCLYTFCVNNLPLLNKKYEFTIWLSCLCPLVQSSKTLLNYMAFQYFDIERHLMKVIPETRRAHSFWYLRFYCNISLSCFSTNSTLFMFFSLRHQLIVVILCSSPSDIDDISWYWLSCDIGYPVILTILWYWLFCDIGYPVILGILWYWLSCDIGYPVILAILWYWVSCYCTSVYEHHYKIFYIKIAIFLLFQLFDYWVVHSF